MENQKYSGEVNLDHPVIDERPDGSIKMYFHDLPPILLKNRIIFSDEDYAPPDENVETQNLASPSSNNP